MSNQMITVIALSHFGCVLLGGASAMLFREVILEKEESEMINVISKLRRENRELTARIKWQYDIDDKIQEKAAGEAETEAEGQEPETQEAKVIKAFQERNQYLIERNDMLAEQVAYLKRNGESAHQNMFRAYIVAVIVGLMALITTTAMYNYTVFIIRKA